jgi:predicted PurR-regulated permease PerM
MVWSLLLQFSDLILLFVFAWVISFLLEPVVGALSSLGWVPRTVAVLLVYLALLVALGGAAVLLIPVLVAQSELAAQRLPELGQRLTLWAGGITLFLASQGINATDYTGQLLRPLESVGPWLVANAVTLAAATASIILQIVLTIVLSVYFMLEGEHLAGRLMQGVPHHQRDDVSYFISSVYRAFGGFLRGQIIQSLVYGAGIAAIMIATGLPFVALISVLAGVSIFIPFVGPFLGVIPPIVVALVVDPTKTWFVAVGAVLLNIVVVNIVAPKVMSQQIGLNPILVLAAVLIGARLGGPWGALFGVPVAAVLMTMASFYQLTVAERERRLLELEIKREQDSATAAAPPTEPIATTAPRH